LEVDPFSAGAVRRAYDDVAVDYADAFGDDLARLPLDREMLDAALAVADGHGWVLEAGCGPARPPATSPIVHRSCWALICRRPCSPSPALATQGFVERRPMCATSRSGTVVARW
jgi:hypothetical protein